MKNSFLMMAVFVVCSSASAEDFRLVGTCSNPQLVEGELQVRLSKDRKNAVVSLSGVKNFPTQIVSVGGPVMAFDYMTGGRTERIIIAVDGGHELHFLDKASGNYRKAGNLTCR